MPKLPKRFWKKIRPARSGCWEWTGCSSRGYGYICIKGKMTRAHRVMYELSVGEIPDGFQVMHRCDNRICVNPMHLCLGTNKDNMVDAAKKDRMGKKLTAFDVSRIRAMAAKGHPQPVIAGVFNVNQSTISRVVSRQRRQHI